jgi:tetratricopeptide (TPR) repeat protein
MAATPSRQYANRTVEVTGDMIEEAFREGHAATTVLLGSHWLRADRDDFFTVLKCAEMLYLTNQYEDAIGVYESALRRFEEHQWAIFNQMGRMYEYWGRAADAEPWFQKAVDIDPDDWASYSLLGECQARQGKLKQAEATYRAWLKREECWLTYYQLALVLRNQRLLAEAAECFHKSIELKGTNTVAADALADVEKAIALANAGLA